MEAVFEVFMEVILIGIFAYPGALFRWTISRLWRSKKTFKEYFDDHPYANGMLGILLFALVAILYSNRQPIIYSLTGEVKIVDEYFIYDYLDRHPNGELTSGRQVLICKLGNENDPLIENISFIEWNAERMMVHTDGEYFSIEANEYGLKCGCNNKLRGPMTLTEAQEYKARTGFEPTEDLKTK
jgi:hypothetical protein